MFFDKPETQIRSSDTKALGEPTTFTERTEAALRAAQVQSNAFQGWQADNQAYDDRIKAIRDAGLDDLSSLHPMRRSNDLAAYGEGWAVEFGVSSKPEDPHVAFQSRLDELQKKHPDKAWAIQAEKPISRREGYWSRVNEAERVSRSYAGPYGTGVVADFIGGMGAQATDPVNLPTLFMGPTGAVKQGTAAIMQMALKQAAANAGIEAVQQPGIQMFRKQMGDSYGVSQAALDVAMAGGLGFGVDAGVRGIYRGIQKGVGRVAITDPASGGVVGYESKAASEARAKAAERIKAIEAIAPETIQKAQAGDLPSIKEVLTATGEMDDPSVRGAVQALELHPELRDSPIDDLDYGARERQMMRALTDGAEPFPVDVPPVRQATGPDLNDFAELPKGIDGNQHYRNFDIDGKPVAFKNLDPKDITTDATAFQFKSGGDGSGVTGKLGAVQTWDPMASGKVVVFERLDGSLVIADGHQRLGLAKSLIDQNPALQGFVFREADGWTTGDVRALAAKKNLQEGSGDILDAAKIIKDRPDIIDDKMPLGTEFMRLSRALARLEDEAFGKVVGGVIEPKHGAMIADLVHDKSQHSAVIDELARLDPKTDREARVAIGEIVRAPLTMEEQTSLFGGSIAPRFLMVERVGVLDGVLGTLRRDQRVFSTLANNADRAEEVGNKLKTKANVRQALEAETIAAVVEKLAQRSGYVSNLLNQAAKSVAEGQPKQRAVDAFLRQIAEKIRSSGIKGLDDDAVILASLPQTMSMDFNARMARARSMGFDTSRILYHGTGDEIVAFDLAKAQDKEGRKRGLGLGKGKVYLTGNQWSAGEWAMQAPERGLGNAPNVLPVMVRGRLLDEPDYMAKFKEFSGGKAIFDATLEMKERDALIAKVDKWAKSEGYSGVQQVDRDQTTGEIMDTGQVAMFNPNDIRSVNAEFADADGPVLLASLRGGDAATGKSMRADLDALGYYSKALEAAKSWPQGKGTPEQALMWLKKSGVKDAEIEATKVGKAFEGQKSITRDDLVKYLTENRVGLRESKYGNVRTQADADLLSQLGVETGPEFSALRANEGLKEAKFSSYSLDPSNPTYRETVLHLPENRVAAIDARLAELNAEINQLSGNMSRDISAENLPRYQALRSEAKMLSDERADLKRKNFRSGHFPEPNITGHMMTSMVKHEGKPVYLIDQIQSDWGQKLRDGGVRDEAKIAEISQQLSNVGKVYETTLAEIKKKNAANPNSNSWDWSEINKLRADEERLKAELAQAKRSATGNPLVNTTDQWTTTTLRRALRQAAEADAEFIAIPHGDTVLSYNPEGQAGPNGMREFYGRSDKEGIVPKNLRKILEKIDKDAAKGARVEKLEAPTKGLTNRGDLKISDGGSDFGFTLFPLTEKVKRAVVEDGQPLFQKQDAKKLSQDVEAFAAHLESVLKDAEKPEPPRMMDDVLKEGPKQTAEMMERFQGEQAMRAATAEASRLAAAKSLNMSPEARMARADAFRYPQGQTPAGKEVGRRTWMHGANRADRISKAGKFDARRATSGPMAFFTDSTDVASNYAKGKSDTSLADDGDVANYFTVSPRDLGSGGRSPITVERSWLFLTPEQKAEIVSKAKRVGYENPEQATGPLTLHSDGVEATLSGSQFDYLMKTSARGNPLTALRELWHDGGELVGNESEMMTIWRLAGYPHKISDETAPWFEAPGVVPVYLSMKNPVDTHDAAMLRDVVIPALELAFKNDRSRLKEFGADAWDKDTRFTPRQWVEELKKDVERDRNSFVWTSIPDKVTAELKKLGFDGILDRGNKGGSGVDHAVAVPFNANQVRSVNAAFDPAESASAKLLAALPSENETLATSAIARLSQEIEAAYPGATRLISDALDAAPDLRARIMEMAGDPNQQRMARSLMEAALPPRAPVDVPQQVNTSQPLGYTVTSQPRMAEIRAEIDRTIQMLPPDVRIRVEDQLVFNMGGKDVRVDGLWDGYDKIVYVALAAGDPVRTVRHEVIHALRQTGLMTRDEFNALYAFAEKLKLREAYNIDSMYRDGYTRAYGHKGNDYVELLLREETVANMFSDYSLNGRRFGDVAGGGIVDQIIDKIVRFMTAVRDRLDILGFKQVRDIFEEIESGRMAMRGQAASDPRFLATVKPGMASEAPVIQEIRDLSDLAGACKS